MYDLFISYRREGGYELARLLYSSFKELGLNAFFDVEELRSGPFDEKLYNYIKESQNFVLVLSPNCLDRCSNEGDWVRLEIEKAISLNKNIVPVMMKNFTFPEKLPKGIESLPMFNGATINQEYFNASIEKIVSLLVNVKPRKPGKITQEQQAHIEELYHRGMELLDKQSFGQASACFEEIRDIAPSYVRSYWGQLLAFYRCSSNNELILNTSEDFNESQLLSSALALAGESDYRIYTDVLAKRTKNCLKLCKESLKGNKYDNAIKYANLVLQKKPNDEEVLWLKLLAECGVSDAKGLYKYAVNEKGEYTKLDTYKKLYEAASEEKKAELDKLIEDIKKTKEEGLYKRTYEECDGFITQKIGKLHEEEEALKTELVKDFKAKRTEFNNLKQTKGKFYNNNLFSFTFSVFCLALPFILVILAMMTLQIPTSLDIPFWILCGIFGIVLLVKIKGFISSKSKFEKIENTYEKLSNSIREKKTQLTKTQKAKKEIEAIYENFKLNKNPKLEEIAEVRSKVKKVI